MANQGTTAPTPEPQEQQKGITISLPNATPEMLKASFDKAEAAYTETAATRRELAELTARLQSFVSSFYERVVLVEGGTFALSLTYIAALSSHIKKNSVHLGVLQFGWVALFVSMAAAFFCVMISGSAAALVDLAAVLHVKAREDRAWSDVFGTFGRLFTKPDSKEEEPEHKVAYVFSRIATTYHDTGWNPMRDDKPHLSKAKGFLKLAGISSNVANLAGLVAFLALFYFAIQTLPLFLSR